MRWAGIVTFAMALGMSLVALGLLLTARYTTAVAFQLPALVLLSLAGIPREVRRTIWFWAGALGVLGVTGFFIFTAMVKANMI